MLRSLRKLPAILSCVGSLAGVASGEERRGQVIDTTSLAVPGASVEFRRNGKVVSSTTSGADGNFALNISPGDDGRLVVSLRGFETVTAAVAPTGLTRIVLPIGRAADTVDVTASTSDEEPAGGSLGAGLSGPALQDLPTTRQHVRDALPLLPAVMRGPDGLLRIDGARPHEAPLLLDGFDVTDPATGLSSIDLPLESVRRVDVLRDPTAVQFGGALGSLVEVESRVGGESIEGGVQGFFPRPRLTGGGLGRLEGFFPRAYVGGPALGGRARYLIAAEYDFERIPVPGVTDRTGSPDTKETGATLFARMDTELSDKHILSVEGFVFPSKKSLFGLSPLRSAVASPSVQNSDRFLGIVDRHKFGQGILTLRLGVLSHFFHLRPAGSGESTIAPGGRAGGFFSTLDRNSARRQASAEWNQTLGSGVGRHELTAYLLFKSESLNGVLSERPVRITDSAGKTVREIAFGGSAQLRAQARGFSVAFRDLWQASERLALDGGLRIDSSSLVGSAAPSARFGVRYELDASGATVVKARAGMFVGTLPLSVPAFGDFPVRSDRSLDPLSHGVLQSVALRPTIGSLSLPRALALNLLLERRIAPGWDVSIGAGLRRSSHLATLDVQPAVGLLTVRSDGRSRFSEMEVALRHTWGAGNQAFFGYTRSSARGSVNDFSTLFAEGDREVLLPGGTARLAADAPNRLLAWATWDVAGGFSIAPAMEWHSGFPYSTLSVRREYRGGPHSASFPSFFSLDVLVSKTFAVAGKKVRVGAQMFNVTNHKNPRDVYAVAGASTFGSFTNSVGPTLRGVLAVSW